MPEKTYIVTGAGSGIGASVLETLSGRVEANIVGLVTPRSAARGFAKIAGVDYLTQDLLEPLSSEAGEALDNADRILHLAWSRSLNAGECMSQNMQMLARLLNPPGAGERLIFVSSVAAASNARSVYGKVKYRAQQRVLDSGGTVLVCGLVVADPPETAHKVLVDTILKAPGGIVPVPPGTRVYPVQKDVLIEAIVASMIVAVPAGAYRLFAPGGVPLSDFVREIAAARGKRARVIPIPQFTVDLAANILRPLGARGLAEKLATFFFKNQAELDALTDFPGLLPDVTGDEGVGAE